MRSEPGKRVWREAAAPPRAAGGVGTHARLRCGLAVALLLVLAAGPAVPQYDFGDEPLLASAIPDTEVALRGRYVRQWTADTGELVLLYSGGFRLTMGLRELSAADAVVWLRPERIEPEGRKYYALTVYLSGNAEVREPGGTTTVDDVLLVRGLRTRGPIVRRQDAHAAENAEGTELYRQALAERRRAEAGEPAPPRAAPSAPPPTAPGPAAPAPAVSAPAAPPPAPPAPPRPPRVVRYRLPSIEPAETAAGERVLVATGGVYFSQAGGPDAAVLEIRADHCVVFPLTDAAGTLFGEEAPAGAPAAPPAEPLPEEPSAGTPGGRAALFPPAPENGEAAPDGAQTPAEAGPPSPRAAPTPPHAPPARPDLGGLGGEGAALRIRAVYLEGDVVLSAGNRFVRAARLYYDFERDQALILDAVFRAEIPVREIPLYIRADEIRQLSTREFEARNAKLTTSEFYTPSYHVGAERVYIRDTTPRDETGRATSGPTGYYRVRNATLNVLGLPIAWWPGSEGPLDASETLLRSLRLGYSSDRGAEFASRWYLFNLLGVATPPGFDATLRLDYFSERGPGIGVNVDYARDDYYGLLRTYYLHDDGRDSLGPLRRYDETPSTSERGRVLWRHRHYLPNDWEATLELAYVSDPYFLEEWEKSEWFEGKEQETALYLKRARDTEAITLLANWRTLDFVNQTEHLPELGYRRIGDTWFDPLVLYHESRIGMVRYRPDDRQFFDERRFNTDGLTDATFRVDARQEAELPLKLGPVSLVPFGSARGTYWDGQPLDDGGLWRGLGVAGVRGAVSFSRVFDAVRSELLDIHRLRHVIKPDFAAWWAGSNVRSEQLTPFDYGIETIDPFYGATFGLRQTWQTQRGAADRRRTVDLLTVGLEVGVFGDTGGRRDRSNGYANPLRPENSRTRNYIAGDVVYRLSDTTSLLYDFNFDLNDRSFDSHNVSLALERNPRLAYVLGARYAGDIDLAAVGGGWNYRISEKHITAVRSWFDVDTGDVGEVAFAYIRKLPRWYVGINLEYDNIEDDFSVSLSLWPEGIPEWTLGSRRFTGLATTTGIKP